jgi:hypothetical protein
MRSFARYKVLAAFEELAKGGAGEAVAAVAAVSGAQDFGQGPLFAAFLGVRFHTGMRGGKFVWFVGHVK